MAINSSTPKFNIEAHKTQKKDNDKNMSMKKNKNKKVMKKKVISPPSPPRPHLRDHQVISSWEQLKSILSCKAIVMASQVHDPSKEKPTVSNSNYAKLRSSCGPSICAFRDVVHGNTRVGHRSDTDRHSGSSSPGASRRHETAPLTRSSGGSCSSSSKAGGMPLRRLSGCYECHAISIDSASRRYPRPRTTLSACSECGEVFTKSESLELHQIIRHAVSELGPEDSGRQIVEIIFKSSWHRRALPACKIERILKVRNSPRTVARFEEYRAAVKSRALNPKKHPRCAADGNELLRFHPAILSCALGSGSSLCSSPACGVCGIIRHGFAREACGVRTTASSGRAHELGHAVGGVGSKAMMVCRVIAGRVRRAGDEEDAGAGGSGYDSLAGADANLEDLSVGNPRAILPCFVVIYRLVE
ncbi:uncharacterized protein LOC120275048 [Dioscorea cayenensis subsp. rotundata]|uniref:Uncharacterized protein LOC120275048 n=1 Tax=Dioscorea cayennensis subsp. rotundata TaxID=55577 RepID=A0AB40CC73_DIOCR|nr:uncharacterized protein LOC120275048 [Dioscorea cayenensis subsp. rotundata]